MSVFAFMSQTCHFEPHIQRAGRWRSERIERVSALQKLSVEKESEILRDQIQSAEAVSTTGHGSSLLPYDRREGEAGKLETLRKTLGEKEAELEKKKGQVAELFSKRKQLIGIKQANYEAVLKVVNAAEKTLPGETDTKRFLLLSHFASPSLVKHLQNRGKELGVKVEIDEALVQAVIEEEKQNREKAQKAASRGQADMKAREISGDEKIEKK